MSERAKALLYAWAELPLACWDARRSAGWRGVYLAIADRALKGLPFPVELPGFGLITRRAEATNYIDNISRGELRCSEVENTIRTTKAPLIVDAGVNVGMSVRWWFNLNTGSTVVGIDMISEALDFTTEALTRIPFSGRWLPLCSAIGDRTGTIELATDDPLEGTTGLLSRDGKIKRKVKIDTIDNLLRPLELNSVTLLKIDIEGYGGQALLGATATLERTLYVVLETHDVAETRIAAQALIGASFIPFLVRGRTIWWQRTAPTRSGTT